MMTMMSDDGDDDDDENIDTFNIQHTEEILNEISLH